MPLSTDQGHQALAELLAGVVRTAAHNVAAAGGPAALLDGSSSSSSGSSSSGSSKSGDSGKAQQVVLPPPMIPGNADQATTLCAMQVRCVLSWWRGRNVRYACGTLHARQLCSGSWGRVHCCCTQVAAGNVCMTGHCPTYVAAILLH